MIVFANILRSAISVLPMGDGPGAALGAEFGAGVVVRDTPHSGFLAEMAALVVHFGIAYDAVATKNLLFAKSLHKQYGFFVTGQPFAISVHPHYRFAAQRTGVPVLALLV